MNRLTKQVNLVLISSSLVLHGCRGWHEEEQKGDPQRQLQQTGTQGTQNRTHTSHHTRFFPFFGGSSRSSVSPGVHSGIRSGGSSSTSRSSVGGSARGGFGASAHGASS